MLLGIVGEELLGVLCPVNQYCYIRASVGEKPHALTACIHVHVHNLLKSHGPCTSIKLHDISMKFTKHDKLHLTVNGVFLSVSEQSQGSE